MPETHKAVRQHMQQEAADTFVSGERHRLHALALTTMTVGEAHPAVPDLKETVVRDGDAMRVAAYIVQDLCRPCQRRLGIDDPLLAVELLKEGNSTANRGPRTIAR
jgi:hypothetical protein